MDLELTPDQVELRTVAAELLDRYAPAGSARAFLDGAGDTSALWGAVGDAGWYGVGLDDDDPFGVPGLCLLAEAAGRRVATLPLVDGAVTARAIAGAPAVRDAWLERLTEGTTTVSLAVLETAGSWSLSGHATRARRSADGTGWVLDGEKLAVQHATQVDALAVLATVDGEPGLVLVPTDAEGLTAVAVEGLDPTARTARVRFDDVVVADDAVVHGPDARAALEAAFAVGAVATVAEASGAGSAALDLAVDFAGEREQFGRPIGRFQALQHLLAEAHVLRETCWSTTLYAAAAADEGTADAAQAAAVAKSHVTRSARVVVEAALQALGGVGFTWEHDLHLYLRRVISLEGRFGDAGHHERVIADGTRQAAAVTTKGA